MADKNTTPAPKAVGPKPLSKSQLRSKIAEQVGLTAKQVGEVLEALSATALSELQRAGVGVFTVPGVVKLTKVVKPAVKGGVEKPNPFKKGEMMITKDKPEKAVLRVRVVKAMKEGVTA